jgi:hypothetical protein
MNLNITGLPALAIGIGFVIVLAAPVWLAAKIIGAECPTLFRSALALLSGLIGAVLSAATTGAWAVLLVPISFLLSIKYVLGTSLLGAFLLAILAASGYAAMAHFIGGGLSVSPS